MHVLQEDPVTLFGTFLEQSQRSLLLSLTHGDVDQVASGNRLVLEQANFLDILSWIDTWEKHEEHGGIRRAFREDLVNVEARILNVLRAHRIAYKYFER